MPYSWTRYWHLILLRHHYLHRHLQPSNVFCRNLKIPQNFYRISGEPNSQNCFTREQIYEKTSKFLISIHNYKTTIIKALWYQDKSLSLSLSGLSNQWNRLENSEITLCKYGQMIKWFSTRIPRPLNHKIGFSKHLWKGWISTCKRIVIDLMQKLKWILKTLNIRAKTKILSWFDWCKKSNMAWVAYR